MHKQGRGRERERKREKERKRKRERIPSRFYPVSMEADVGVKLTNNEITT